MQLSLQWQGVVAVFSPAVGLFVCFSYRDETHVMVSGISSKSMCSIASLGDNVIQIAVPVNYLSRQTSATLETKTARQIMLVDNGIHLHDRLRFCSSVA